MKEGEKCWVTLRDDDFDTEYGLRTHVSYFACFINPLNPTYKNFFVCKGCVMKIQEEIFVLMMGAVVYFILLIFIPLAIFNVIEYADVTPKNWTCS